MGCEVSKGEIEDLAITQINRKVHKNAGVKYQFNSTDKIQQSVSAIDIEPSQDDSNKLEKGLMEHFFFYKLQKKQRFHLIKNLTGYSAKKGDVIFRKGDVPNLFFYIKSGCVSVDIGDVTENKLLGPGSYFGQLALLYKSPRSATIIAQEDCLFFCLSHEIFRKTIQEVTIKNFSNAQQHIDKASIFKYLTNRQKVAIAYNTHTLKFIKNDIIFKLGQDANSFYIITKGRIQIQIPGKKQIVMTAGQSFGENSFQEGSIRSGTAVVLQKTSILSIGRESLSKCIGGYLQEMSFINIMKWSMSRHQSLKKLSDLERQKIISVATIFECQDEQVIAKIGEVSNSFYICLQGKINEGEVGKIENFEYIMDEQSDRIILEQLKKYGEGKIAAFQFIKVKKILGRKFSKIFQEIQSSVTQQKKKHYFDDIKLQSLKIKYQLGQGLFGKVYCVEDQFKIEYALKCIEKEKVIKNQMEKFVILQKKISEEIQSTFIVKLLKTFSNQENIFFLLKYIDGGDFFKVLRNIGVCDKQKARFYLGCLILAIEHLHQRNIIYRDIKPENTVVDKAGFLYLVDLGAAKYLEKGNGYKTFTIVGTPHYMAPQIISGEGYSFAVDLWSMGIFFYEMVCGALPFGNQLEDPYEIFREIVKSGDVVYPKHYKDASGIYLIDKLLAKDQRQRSTQDFSRIKNISFFDNFDWQQLQKKTMDSPFTINRDKLNVKIDEPLLKFLKNLKDEENKKDENNQQYQLRVVSNNSEWNQLFP